MGLVEHAVRSLRSGVAMLVGSCVCGHACVVMRVWPCVCGHACTSPHLAADDGVRVFPVMAAPGRLLQQPVTLRERKVRLLQMESRRWRSNPSGKCSQERLTRGTVISTMRRAARPSGRGGAGCSTIKYQYLRQQPVTLPPASPSLRDPAN